ncbi:hypothetical protein VDG1235_3601 [Verrucomicrobiia bacterium DG1235]|nr:hypothetical protein VDG1235_3601 [Verrucomicrobiae bacterium DG1235]
MKPLKATTLVACCSFAGSVGYFASTQTRIEENSELIGVTKDSIQAVSFHEETANNTYFTFENPFSPRRELNRALGAENAAERYGRFLAIGYHSAQEHPLQNLESLSPEIWNYENYDLRGAFFSEWMRKDPEEFLPWAEAKYLALAKDKKLELFPTYHLAYLEPIALLELLPKIKVESFADTVRNDLLGTLLEKDAALLWKRRNEIASLNRIIEKASDRGLLPLALQFWRWSEWEDLSLPDRLYEYMAKHSLLNDAIHLVGYQRTLFAVHYAAFSPAAAANWVRAQPTLYDFIYEFDNRHTAYFRALLASQNFHEWSDASAWIREAISSDEDTLLAESVFAAIQLLPDSAVNIALIEDLNDYLYEIDNDSAIEKFYLSLDSNHPVLAEVEAYLLSNQERFGQVLTKRATRELPTPDRLLKAFALGNIDNWPDSYFESAKASFAQMSDDELLWSLAPNMLLTAAQFDSERIQNLVANADPVWIQTTLSNSGFLNNVSLESLELVSEMISTLPADQARSINENAKSVVIQTASIDSDHQKYIKIASRSEDINLIANSISLEDYQNNPELQAAIKAHPRKEEFYQGIVSSNNAKTYQDPDFQNAFKQLEKGRALLELPADDIVSNLQSLPKTERLDLAKATVIVSNDLDQHSDLMKLFELPIWSDDDKKELYDLGFKNYLNFNLHSGIDW